MKLTIMKAENGYIIDRDGYYKELTVYRTLDEVAEFVLAYFEHRRESWSGDCYGKVTIQREVPNARSAGTSRITFS